MTLRFYRKSFLERKFWFWRLRRNVKRWVRFGFKRPTKAHKVFCVGWLKTATTSTGRALEVLGYRHLTYQWDLQHIFAKKGASRILRVAEHYDSFDDLPWNKVQLLPELVRAYPDAKFILTTRSQSAWLASYRKYFGNQDERSDAELISSFEAHNEQVAQILNESGCQWIELRIENDLSWETLCGFLNEPAPSIAFPRANTIAQHLAVNA